MSRALILIDPELVSARLQVEEQKWATRLAQLENLIRTFEDQDHPNFQIWIRTALGPKLQEQKELIDQIQERRSFARSEAVTAQDNRGVGGLLFKLCALLRSANMLMSRQVSA